MKFHKNPPLVVTLIYTETERQTDRQSWRG